MKVKISPPPPKKELNPNPQFYMGFNYEAWWSILEVCAQETLLSLAKMGGCRIFCEAVKRIALKGLKNSTTGLNEMIQTVFYASNDPQLKQLIEADALEAFDEGDRIAFIEATHCTSRLKRRLPDPSLLIV